MERRGGKEEADGRSRKQESENRVEASTESQSSQQSSCHLPTVTASSQRISASEIRVLLWDIDGTLLRSARVGAFKEYTVPVLEEVFGTSGRLKEMSVSGMTDMQIVLEALRDEGFTHERVRASFALLRERYMAAIRRATGNGAPLFQLLPGAREILEAAAQQTRYLSALCTGNIEPAAHLKIELVGLTEFFRLPGAFGDDSHDRRVLPRLAAARINRHLKLNLEPSQFIVIGDTPNDIACAKHFGARSVAVCTNRIYTASDLKAHEPDALLPDLSDTKLVMQTFDSL